MFENFVGQPRYIPPMLTNKFFRLLLDLDPISALDRLITSDRIKNAINDAVIMLARCVIKSATSARRPASVIFTA